MVTEGIGPSCRSQVCRSSRWRVAEDRADSLLVVVIDVLAPRLSEMGFIEHDHVIEQISLGGSNPTSTGAILQADPRFVDFGSMPNVAID